MKILVNQVPFEGILLEEGIDPGELDLETELIKFGSPLKLKARAWRITNALSVDLNIKAKFHVVCSRCLKEFDWDWNKDAQLNYPLDNSITFIDLNPEIREEVMLDYPIKPLCDLNCKGLCKKCGINKNEGGCNCGST
ncbi:MAG: DUF177 domain-containing protein [Candidatus Omnitrophota bacterium]